MIEPLQSNKNHGSRRLGIAFLLILGLIMGQRKVSAQTGIFSVGESMVLGLELITFLLFLGIVIFNIQSHRKLGNSIVSLPFIYIMFGLILTIFTRIFLIANELDVYDVQPMVIGIYWHLFLYMSIFLFMIAIERVADRTKDKELKSFSWSDGLIIGLVLLVSIFLFITPETIGVDIMMQVMGTVIPEWGLLHFLAFTFTSILLIRVFVVLGKTRKTPVGKYMNAISIPFLVFLIVSTSNHFTALIAESWELVTISNLEVIEQGLWIISFAVMLYGYFKLNIEINRSHEELDVEEETPQDTENENEIAPVVLELLSDHVGTLAFKVMLASSKDSGVNLANLDKSNITQFATAIEKNTTELIGEFPSRYLKVSIQKKVAAM